MATLSDPFIKKNIRPDLNQGFGKKMKPDSKMRIFIMTTSVFSFVCGILSTVFILIILLGFQVTISNPYGVLGFGLGFGLLIGLMSGIIAAIVHRPISVSIHIDDPVSIQEQLDDELREEEFQLIGRDRQIQIYEVDMERFTRNTYPVQLVLFIEYTAETVTIAGPYNLVMDMVNRIKPPKGTRILRIE